MKKLAAALTVLAPFVALAADSDSGSTASSIAASLFVMLQPVLAALGAAVAAMLTAWINSKIKNEKARAIIARSEDIVIALVKRSNQTIVSALKEAAADGKITDAEKAKIKAAVVSDFKSMVGMDGLKALGYAVGLSDAPDSLERWIDTKVEAAVHDVKLVTAAAENAASFQAAPSKP